MKPIKVYLDDFQWQQHEYDIEVIYTPYMESIDRDSPPDYAEILEVRILGITKDEHDAFTNDSDFMDAVLDEAIEMNDYDEDCDQFEQFRENFDGEDDCQ